MSTAKLRKFFGLTVVAVIYLGICPNNNLVAQDASLDRLNALVLKNALNFTDTTVISGILNDEHKMLLTNFKPEKVDKFYDSVLEPQDYFVNMKKCLGWRFGNYAKNMQTYILDRHGFDSTSQEWNIKKTPNFMIYYMPSSTDSSVIRILGDYLESEFVEMKNLLAINEDQNRRSLFIRSFYPDSEKSYEIPTPPELTNGKIQILLFPNLDEFQRHFPGNGVDQNTGGMCLFSLYQNPEKAVRDIFIDVKVAMIFAGYISFPFMTHELGHAMHFIYYSDLDSVNKEAARLYEIYEKQGKDEYYKAFWPNFRDRIPGHNGIFEEAIANYCMFSTGPLWRSGITPPLNCLIYTKLKNAKKYISPGAKSGVDFGFLNLIGWKLHMSQSPGKKIATAIFVWSNFLKYLNDSYTPEQMSQLYSITDEDLSKTFRQIFGRTVKQAAAEWSDLLRNKKSQN
jgi:hypothetical protein